MPGVERDRKARLVGRRLQLRHCPCRGRRPAEGWLSFDVESSGTVVWNTDAYSEQTGEETFRFAKERSYVDQKVGAGCSR